MEVDDLKCSDIKEALSKEYFRRIREILTSKLNSRNIVSPINSRGVSMVQYRIWITNWIKEEFRELDRITRKLLTINRSHHPPADVNRLEKIGGRENIREFKPTLRPRLRHRVLTIEIFVQNKRNE